MTEQEALEKAERILNTDNGRELILDDGQELLKLENFIDGNKFGNLIEAFYAAAPTEVAIEFTENS